MATIADGIAWRGSDVTVSMFTVWDPAIAASLPEITPMGVAPKLSFQPTLVRTFFLEDEGRLLRDQLVFEYDFVFQDIPPDLHATLRQCLLAAREAGARVAWCGFEGSFHFEFLLMKETANLVYAVADSSGVAIATDDTISSKEWEARVVRAGIEARNGAPGR